MTEIAPQDSIDITFDVMSDTPPGGDPDRSSATLRRYHQLLWKRPLPSGVLFDLDATTPRTYLHHASEAGEFWLSSDAITHSYRSSYKRQLDEVIREVPAQLVDEVYAQGCTIGAHILFPSAGQAGQPTINQARGRSAAICDRFDLTLECIRRQYASEDHPLASCLTRFDDFFALFGSFREYVRFWLLDDLTRDDCTAVQCYLPFGDFDRSPLPTTPDEYVTYAEGVLRFIAARNDRISRLTGA